MGGCNQYTKCSREELPHVQGQGQKPGGPHGRRAVANRNYSMSEVRGSSLVSQAATAQEQPRGVTPLLRSGVVAERSYPHPRPRAAIGRSNPTSKERWLCRRRRA